MGVLAGSAAAGASSGALDKVLAHGHAVKLQGRSTATDKGSAVAAHKRKPKRQSTSVPQQWREGTLDRRRLANGGRRYASYLTYEGFTKKAEGTHARKDGFMTMHKEAYQDVSHCKDALKPATTIYIIRSEQDKLFAEDTDRLKMPVCNSEMRDSYLPYTAEEMSNALGASPALEERDRQKNEIARRCAQRRMANQAAAVAAAHGVASELQRSLSAPSIAASSVPPISSFAEVTQLPATAETASSVACSSAATTRSSRHANGASFDRGHSHDAVGPKASSSVYARRAPEASRTIQATQISSDTCGPLSPKSAHSHLEDTEKTTQEGVDGDGADLRTGCAPLSQRGLGSTSSRTVMENACLSSRSSASGCGRTSAKARHALEQPSDAGASNGSSHSAASRAFRVLEHALVADANASVSDTVEVDRAATTKALRTLREALKASKSDAVSVVSTTSGGGVLSISTASAPSTLVAASERYQHVHAAVDEPSLSSNAVLEACLVQQPPHAPVKAPFSSSVPALPQKKQTPGTPQARRPGSATAARATRRANSEVTLPLRSVVYTPHKTTFNKNARPSSAQLQARPRSAP